MEAVTVDKVRPLFYEKYDPEMETGKVLFETHEASWFVDKGGFEIPNNKYELSSLLGKVQQTIRYIADMEWEQNARKLVSIKLTGSKVQYGFTKSKKMLAVSARRKTKRAENAIKAATLEGRSIVERLSDDQKQGLLIDIYDDTFLNIMPVEK